MGVKTITIDKDAYELLARHKRQGESFSSVIKQHFTPRKTAATLLDALPSIVLKESTLTHVETQMKKRHRHTARALRI